MSTLIRANNNVAKRNTKNDIYNIRFKLLHQPEVEIPALVCIRAFLNKPFIRRRKVDIPITEALRTYINMFKANIIHRQINFADVFLVNPQNFIRFPFISDIFKWSPSRNIVLKLKNRQLDHQYRVIYRKESRNSLENSIQSIASTKSLNLPLSYDLFKEYLGPFKIIITKFRLSHLVDEVITTINDESVLRQLEKTKIVKSQPIPKAGPVKRTRVYKSKAFIDDDYDDDSSEDDLVYHKNKKR